MIIPGCDQSDESYLQDGLVRLKPNFNKSADNPITNIIPPKIITTIIPGGGQSDESYV